MPTINFSVTQSIDTLAVNLSASEALVMNINNPLVGASYFGLETIPDSNGVYTSSSPKNTSGSFTLGTGIIGVVKDDYKISAVVSPGNNVLTFSPAVAVTGSTLRTRGINSSMRYDADALAFFARVTTAGGTLSTTEMNATNQLVLDMKYYGLWDSMKAVYPMVGASAAACAQNLKSSSFTGTFTSGWTFSSTGATPNGTSAYMDTNLNENNIMTLNNIHISHYSRTNNTSTVCDIGLLDTLANSGTHTISYVSGNAACRNTDLSSVFTATTTTLSLFINNRTNSAQSKYFWKSSLFNTINSSSISKSNLNYFLAARNNSGLAAAFSNREYAFSSIGDGLTDTQASDFYTVVQAFQTTLSRQV